MARTKEEVLRDLGYDPSVWTVTSSTKTGEEYIPDPTNQYGPKIANLAREETWIITDGHGGRQNIVVKPVPVEPYQEGDVWSPTRGQPTFEIVEAPNRLAPAGTSQPRKGLQRVTASGVLEEVIDDQGTWSAVLDKDGKVIKANTDPPAAGAPTTKTINGKTFQWDTTTRQWMERTDLPTEAPAAADRPPAPTVNTTAKQIPEWNGTDWVFKDNPNYTPPTTAPQTPEQRRLAGAEATTAEAGAALAQPAAETALRQAQANADTAAVNLEDARRKSRQAPTDTQAQAAIQAAQRAAELANQSLEQQIAQSGQLNPLAVEAARVSLSRARTAEKQDILGPLVGLRERIGEIKSLVQSGEITPEQGDMMVSATTRGTTVAEGLKDIGAERTARRQQDVSSRNQLASTFGSTLTQGFGTLADMNKYAAVGSTAGADAFMGLLDIAQERLKGYELPAVPETDFLGLGGGPRVSGLVDAAQQQIAAQPGPAPVTPPVAAPVTPAAPAPAGTPVTINIGGQPQAQAQTAVGIQPQYGASPTAGNTQALGDPYGRTNALVGAASQATPATIGDVFSAYGVTR